MKNILYIALLLSSVIAHSQTTIKVMNLDDGTKVTVPTLTNPALLPSGVTSDILFHNGTQYVSTQPSNSTFQGLANYWGKTGTRLTYTSGNVGIGTSAEIPTTNFPLFVDNGIAVGYSSTFAPVAGTTGILNLGSYTNRPASMAGSHIWAIGNGTNDYGLGIGSLMFTGRTDADGFPISFVVGSSRSIRMQILGDGNIRFNAFSGTGQRIAVLDATGTLVRGTIDPANILTGSFANNKVAYGSSTGLQSTNLFHFTGTNLGVGIATPLEKIDVAGGNINIGYNVAAPNITANSWFTLGSYNAAVTGSSTNHIYAGTGSGTIFGTPLGGLFFQGRSDGDGSSNLYFVTGATPGIRMYVASDGVYIPSRTTGTASTLGSFTSSGKITEAALGTGLSWSGNTLNAQVKVLREESFTATAAQTAFTIAYSAPAASGTSVPLHAYRNGIRLSWVASGPTATQFTFSGTTVTTTANASGDIIVIEYLN